MSASPSDPDSRAASFPPVGAPLDPGRAQQLAAVLPRLTPHEALWLSGYLAAWALQGPAAPVLPATGQGGLLILFGSETGHAEMLAQAAAAQAAALGLPARCLDMADASESDLLAHRHWVIFVSTHGDGEPPESARDVFDRLAGPRAPPLSGHGYALLALGDASYAHFCAAGRWLDERLAALGAHRLHPRLDCDVDYEGAAAAWTDAALRAFSSPGAPASSGPAAEATAREAIALPHPDRHHPFTATVLENLNLNGRGAGKETRHIALSVAGSGLSWLPGDALGILPRNDPALVAELLARLGLPADAPVPGGDGIRTLGEALAADYEITSLTPSFIARYAELTDYGRLHALTRPGEEDPLRRYMAGRQIIDVLYAFPPRGPAAEHFVELLRPLQPRLYSIASSADVRPEEIDLTVGVLRYERHGRPRRGVASQFLATLPLSGRLPVFLSPNPHFRLPADPAVPIVMIAAGTGIAPFRAFLQAREAVAARGPAWLVFGDRHFRTDFLYQTEWQRALRHGRLTRLDVAFSRDQPEKRYVQHVLLEAADAVRGWLADGAHLYVCGDAARLAPAVHQALHDILCDAGRQPPEAAEAALKALAREKRYQRDVY